MVGSLVDLLLPLIHELLTATIGKSKVERDRHMHLPKLSELVEQLLPVRRKALVKALDDFEGKVTSDGDVLAHAVDIHHILRANVAGIDNFEHF